VTNAFHWRGQASIFANDPAFRAVGGNATLSEKSRARHDANVAAGTTQTLHGLSAKADEGARRFRAAALAKPESTADAMARRGKLMKAGI